jgi:hypothetical protein
MPLGQPSAQLRINTSHKGFECIPKRVRNLLCHVRAKAAYQYSVTTWRNSGRRWLLFVMKGMRSACHPEKYRLLLQIGADDLLAFVVISDSLWRRRLGADPRVIGKTIQIDGEPNVVVGVLRPDFRFPSGEGLGPLNQVSEVCGDLQADGI